MTRKLNIGLLGVNASDMNKGCEALLYSELYLLENLTKEGFKFNYYLIQGNSFTILDYNINGLKVRVNQIPSLAFYTFKTTMYSFLNFPRTITKYRHLDYILAIGLGDSFADIYGKERFDEINYPIRFLQKIGKKIVFMPQTIGPFDSKKIESKALISLNNAYYIFPRDLKSYNYCIEHCKNSNIKELIDVAFYLPYTKIDFDKTKIHVGLSVSSLLWNGGYNRNNDFNFIDDYQSLIYQIIEFFISLPEVVVHLTPHVVSGDGLIEDDYFISYNIVRKYNNKKVVLSTFFKNPVMAKSYISGMDFFIGSRMHACIAAFSSGVPVIPLSYSRKFTGLFCDTLRYNNVIDLSQVSNSQVLDIIKELFQSRNILQNNIQTIISDRVQDRKNLIFSTFQNILK